MRIINPITSPIFNKMLITQVTTMKGKGIFKRLFWKRYLKKYMPALMAYKE